MFLQLIVNSENLPIIIDTDLENSPLIHTHEGTTNT